MFNAANRPGFGERTCRDNVYAGVWFAAAMPLQDAQNVAVLPTGGRSNHGNTTSTRHWRLAFVARERPHVSAMANNRKNARRVHMLKTRRAYTNVADALSKPDNHKKPRNAVHVVERDVAMSQQCCHKRRETGGAPCYQHMRQAARHAARCRTRATLNSDAARNDETKPCRSTI